MLKRLSSVFLWIWVVALSAACSVKEDRTTCPCILILDFNRVDRDILDSLSLSVANADGLLCREVVHGDSYGEEYRIAVPKGRVGVNVYSFLEKDGYATLDADGAAMVISEGSECPSVYLCSVGIEALGETHREEIDMSKNFCRLSISMVSDGPCPFILEINGNVSGYGSDGQPMDGVFHFVPDTDENGGCCVRIPRQKDCSLMLRLSDEDGVLRDFAIGEYIVEAGYDWTEKDLKDIEVIIDYAKASITFIVAEWEETISFDVII